MNPGFWVILTLRLAISQVCLTSGSRLTACTIVRWQTACQKGIANLLRQGNSKIDGNEAIEAKDLQRMSAVSLASRSCVFCLFSDARVDPSVWISETR
jgi:hypothetical protein